MIRIRNVQEYMYQENFCLYWHEIRASYTVKQYQVCDYGLDFYFVFIAINSTCLVVFHINPFANMLTIGVEANINQNT